jgi:2,4-dichlorophenol 6-monooxygenase
VLRRNTLKLLSTQSMEFNEHNVEAGFRYDSTAMIPDGTEPTPTPDDIRIYIPDTRPGSPLPHAMLEDADGAILPLMTLVRPGRFLLIAGEDGTPWCDAATGIAKASGVPLDAIRIGHADGDYRDPRSTWARYRQIGKQGAILVRPDRFVAWRRKGASSTAAADLKTALSGILQRKIA